MQVRDKVGVFPFFAIANARKKHGISKKRQTAHGPEGLLSLARERSRRGAICIWTSHMRRGIANAAATGAAGRPPTLHSSSESLRYSVAREMSNNRAASSLFWFASFSTCWMYPCS